MIEVSEKKLYVAIATVFLLGVLLAVANAHHVTTMGMRFPMFVYGISFASLAAGGFIALLFQWKINKIQLNKILKMLPEEDRRILSELIRKNEIEQSKLVLLTGLSKVKVSRTVSKLEQRGIIKKKSFGNTNLIILDM